MAKAVVPMREFREKFGDLDAAGITALLHDFMAQFLHDVGATERKPETAEVKS